MCPEVMMLWYYEGQSSRNPTNSSNRSCYHGRRLCLLIVPGWVRTSCRPPSTVAGCCILSTCSTSASVICVYGMVYDDWAPPPSYVAHTPLQRVGHLPSSDINGLSLVSGPDCYFSCRYVELGYVVDPPHQPLVDPPHQLPGFAALVADRYNCPLLLQDAWRTRAGGRGR